MTSLREAIRRLLGRASDEAGGGPPRPVLSYRMYWTKEARAWSRPRRRRVRAEAEALVSAPGFEPTTYERRYRLASLDPSPHAGASLLALIEVLEGLERFGGDAEEEQA